MHGLHAHGVRGREVACFILEHRTLGWIQPVCCKDTLERLPLWFGQEIGVLNAIDGIEGARKTARREHPFRIGRAAVRIDDTPTGQRPYACGKDGIGIKMIQRNIVHLIKIGRGINLMLAHQACQCGAMRAPILQAQTVCFGFANAERIHNKGRHTQFDLVKQARGRRVERIVEVKDPRPYMRKYSDWHAISIRHATGLVQALVPVRLGEPVIFGLPAVADAT